MTPMVPVLIVAAFIWAACGVATHISAALASDLDPDDDPTQATFGQWRRAAYRRMRTRLRSRMPGRPGGGKPREMLADGAASALAGGALFAAGFLSGATWFAGRVASHRSRQRLRNRRAGHRPSGPAGTRPGGPDRPPPTPLDDPAKTTRVRVDVVDPDPADDTSKSPTVPTGTATRGPIEDIEEIPNPTTAATADPATPPINTAPNGEPMSEILTIHHLFAWARTAAAGAAKDMEEATLRSNAATARAENAAVSATAASAKATELEGAAARFSGLGIDKASLASMANAYEANSIHAANERRRAHAEAALATIARQCAASAEATKQAVLAMEATVRAHQAPHAEAQAITGNAAAHSSVLAAG